MADGASAPSPEKRGGSRRTRDTRSSVVYWADKRLYAAKAKTKDFERDEQPLTEHRRLSRTGTLGPFRGAHTLSNGHAETNTPAPCRRRLEAIVLRALGFRRPADRHRTQKLDWSIAC
jgi:hypothetical protein